MHVWALILGAVFLGLTGGTVYLSCAVGRFGLLRRLCGDRTWLRRIMGFCVVLLGFCLAARMTSVINAIIIFLHTLAFFLIFGLIMRILKKITGCGSRIFWQGWLAVLATVLTLAWGYYSCMHVMKKEYRLTTGKEIGSLRAAFFSDSHIGATFDGDGFARELEKIEAEKPDILLIGGDFVDDWSKREDFVRACEALGQTNFPYGVWYVFGNHDAGNMADRDFSAEDLRSVMAENGIHVMEDTCELIDGRFYVAGRKDKSDRSRKEIGNLLNGLDPSKYILVLDHQPHDYAAEADSAADLVLSGHTHGGQFFPFGYVGKLLNTYDRAYGYERRNNTDFIVSSGIADWALLFKTGTRSEYVIVDIRSGHPGEEAGN
ncbi:metallophosphoesterase [[Clostridium] aminophilum]|uniref:metallophosphoesterase n=1 Tax=[Clostridium] aminophilum TaxID=1526 RepID=UPI00332D0934